MGKNELAVSVGEDRVSTSLIAQTFSRRNDAVVKVVLDYYDIFISMEDSCGLDKKKIPTNKIISVYDKRIEYDAIPLLFIADESSNSKLENLLLFGYFVSSPISIKNPVNSNIPIDIKGLL